MDLPTGTVTFLFTDIEGGERLWESRPAQMPQALERYRMLVRQAVEGAAGYLFKTAGDACYAAFISAELAVHAAVNAQLALRQRSSPVGWGARSRQRDFMVRPTLCAA
jgi:class 3 adenylate cyclase